MKVALVHDWLVSQRGGENVLDAICELYPKADLFTLVHTPGSVTSRIENRKIYTSFLNKMPQASQYYRHFLPLMPLAIESFDMSAYDLILSSSHCVAKGVKKRKNAVHISYVHAPMRYMWDRFDEYFSKGRYSATTIAAAHFFRKYLQKWDQKSATRVDAFMANSNFIAGKIKQYYSREARVVHPFCDSEYFNLPRDQKDFYLFVTALVPYKRVDLAIEAFSKLQKPLVIVGDGPDLERLKKMAKPNIRFLGFQTREAIATLYSQCRALVFPVIEDFGIVPLEAMASGAPVIALSKGGALETVTEKTGVFFSEQSSSSLEKAVHEFEQKHFQNHFNENECRARGRSFSRKKFQEEFLKTVNQVVQSV